MPPPPFLVPAHFGKRFGDTILGNYFIFAHVMALIERNHKLAGQCLALPFNAAVSGKFLIVKGTGMDRCKTNVEKIKVADLMELLLPCGRYHIQTAHRSSISISSPVRIPVASKARRFTSYRRTIR